MKAIFAGFTILLFILFSFPTIAQCTLSIDEVDEFDSLRTVASIPVITGYQIPSEFLTPEGELTIVDEAQTLFTFAQNDSINSFFLTLAALEREYLKTRNGYDFLLKLSNGEVVGLYNVADKGTFDPKTNMRIYNHTGVVPIDYLPALTTYYIEKIRINYPTKKRTITLTPEQQEKLREAIRCVGEAVGLYPLRP